MRIEKLTFSNINSLVGEFEIDFTHPELAAPGIFVITGPTGAGKTSILDAVAFALYGKSPRQRGVSKGSNELMSHGTSQCFAEVQFEQAGEHYIARAEQKRARRGANPFSEARYELRRLTSDGQHELLTNSKREYDRLVPLYTGLSFNNFSRCMMLAQGDFAAFLRSNESERAEVLSTITGTDIYMRIGEVVHERVAAIDRKIAGLMLLPHFEPAERAQKEAARDAAAAELKSTNAKLAHVKTALDWLQEREVRTAALQKATAKITAAKDARQAFTELHAAELGQAERAQAVQPFAVAQSNLQKQLATASEQCREAAKSATKIQSEREIAEQKLLAFQQQQNKQIAQLNAQLALVREQMRPQETQLNLLRKQANKLAEELQKDDGKLAALSEGLADISSKIITTQQELEQAQQLLESSGQDSAPAEHLPLLQARLTDWQQEPGSAELLPPAEQIDTQLAEAQQQLAQAEQLLERLRSIAELKRRQLNIEDQLATLYVDFCEGRLERCPCCGSTVPGERRVVLNDEVLAAEKAVKMADSALRTARATVSELENRRRLAQLRAAFCAELAACSLPPVQDCAAAGQIVQQLSNRLNYALGLQKKCDTLATNLTELNAKFKLQQVLIGEQTRSMKTAAEKATAATDEVMQLFHSFTERWGKGCCADKCEKELTARLTTLQQQLEKEQEGYQSLVVQEKSAVTALNVLSRKYDELKKLYGEANASFNQKLAEQGFELLSDYQAAEQLLPNLEKWRTQRDQLKEQLAAATALFEREHVSCNEHEAANPLQEGETADSLAAQSTALTALQAQQQELHTTLMGELMADDSALLANERVARQEQELRAEREHHDLLKRVLGDKKEGFKQFAQQITFDMLLHRANAELSNLSDRYRLRRNPNRDNGLGLMVIDSALGTAEGRDCSNLSGGESFIVSLALALGLSRMTGSTRIDSLFLDEGFGTLDRDTLAHVLRSLQKLRADGKMIGIISHVESLSERIPARIRVNTLRGGRSTLSGSAAVRVLGT